MQALEKVSQEAREFRNLCEEKLKARKVEEEAKQLVNSAQEELEGSPEEWQVQA